MLTPLVGWERELGRALRCHGRACPGYPRIWKVELEAHELSDESSFLEAFAAGGANRRLVI